MALHATGPTSPPEPPLVKTSLGTLCFGVLNLENAWQPRIPWAVFHCRAADRHAGIHIHVKKRATWDTMHVIFRICKLKAEGYIAIYRQWRFLRNPMFSHLVLVQGLFFPFTILHDPCEATNKGFKFHWGFSSRPQLCRWLTTLKGPGCFNRGAFSDGFGQLFGDACFV